MGGPTLIHLEVGHGRPIFFSTLLHGNEHSGFLALQKILNNSELKRPIIIFIANTSAAQSNLRHLDDGPDFNRVWSEITCDMSQVANDVLEYVKDKELLCSIDIHNNTLDIL